MQIDGSKERKNDVRLFIFDKKRFEKYQRSAQAANKTHTKKNKSHTSNRTK